jgi:hypothetical protein
MCMRSTNYPIIYNKLVGDEYVTIVVSKEGNIQEKIIILQGTKLTVKVAVEASREQNAELTNITKYIK